MAESERIRNITDLARLANVSAGTVSRALSNSPLISAKTRERIQALAREHDFRPNILARNLRIKRSGAIGVVIPLGHEVGQHVSDPFFMTLIGYLADMVTDRGYDLLLSRVIPSSSHWLDHIVDSGRVDGVIVIGQSNQEAVLERVAARYLPMVVWGAQGGDQAHCTVGTDNRKGGYLAAKHLIARGAQRLAFVGDAAPPEIAARLAGCEMAVKEAGLYDAFRILPAHLTPDRAYVAIKTWMTELKELPDGVVAESDVVAMSLLRAMAEAGLSAPKDIRIAGYDDLPFAAQTVPPLTTIRQDLLAGAAHLVDLLFRRIAGEKTLPEVLEPQLVVRGSS